MPLPNHDKQVNNNDLELLNIPCINLPIYNPFGYPVKEQDFEVLQRPSLLIPEGFDRQTWSREVTPEEIVDYLRQLNAENKRLVERDPKQYRIAEKLDREIRTFDGDWVKDDYKRDCKTYGPICVKDLFEVEERVFPTEAGEETRFIAKPSREAVRTLLNRRKPGGRSLSSRGIAHELKTFKGFSHFDDNNFPFPQFLEAERE